MVRTFRYANFLVHSSSDFPCIYGNIWDKIFDSLIVIGFNFVTKYSLKAIKDYIDKEHGKVLGVVKTNTGNIVAHYVIVRRG